MYSNRRKANLNQSGVLLKISHCYQDFKDTTVSMEKVDGILHGFQGFPKLTLLVSSLLVKSSETGYTGFKTNNNTKQNYRAVQ